MLERRASTHKHTTLIAERAVTDAKAKAKAGEPTIDEWGGIEMGSNELDGECGEVFTLVAGLPYDPKRRPRSGS